MATCLGCGVSYEKNVVHQLYCNRNCLMRHYRRTGRVGPRATNRFVPETRKCRECQTEFLARGRTTVYCSKRCGIRYNGRMKYWKNKRDNPEMAERHAERRRQNHVDWANRNRADNKCVRCGRVLLPNYRNTVCEVCMYDLGKW